MPRALKSFRLLPLLLLGLLGQGFAKEPEWVEVRSPHFSVVTDAGERRGRETALRFEQMRVVFGALMSKSKVTLPVPLQIVAFRNTKEMRQFVPLWNGKPTQVAGLFQASQDRSFIMVDMSVEDPWRVVFHEYAHQLLNGNVPSFLKNLIPGTLKQRLIEVAIAHLPREIADRGIDFMGDGDDAIE